MCFMDVSELVTRKKEVACKRIDISKTDSPRIEAKKTFISKTCWFQTYPKIYLSGNMCFLVFSLIIFELNVDNALMRAKVQSLWRMTPPSRQALDSRDFSSQGGAYHIIHINMHHSFRTYWMSQYRFQVSFLGMSEFLDGPNWFGLLCSPLFLKNI